MGASADTSASASKRRWITALRWAVSLGLIAYVLQRLLASFGDLRHHRIPISWPWACASFLGLLLFLLICSQAWRRLVLAFGETVGRIDAFRLMFTANLAKYLPGGVWGMVGLVALCRREDMDPIPVSLSLLLDIACQVVGATLAALPALSVIVAGGTGHARGITHPVWLVVVAALLVLAVHPRVMNTALGIGERLLRRTLPRITAPYRFILGMLLIYTLAWGLFAISFAALARAILGGPASAGQFLALMGAFLISYNAGVLAFFLPGGLGAREVVLVLLLGPLFAPGFPAIAALVERFWILTGEVLAFGVAVLLARSARARREPAEPA